MKRTINPLNLRYPLLFMQILTCCLYLSISRVNANEDHQPGDTVIQVSPNGRYLQWSNGKPIYIHADTGWSLTRDYSPEEVAEYLDITKEQKFNAVQMSAVFHEVRANQDIIGPAFYDGDFTRPKKDYWNQVDQVVHEAQDGD